MPHGTDVRLDGGNHEDAGIFFCGGVEAKFRSLIFHASLHLRIWKLNRMRLSPQAIHAIAQGSDDVQGCRVEVEFAFRGSPVVCVRRRSVVNGPKVGDTVLVQFDGEAQSAHLGDPPKIVDIQRVAHIRLPKFLGDVFWPRATQD